MSAGSTNGKGLREVFTGNDAGRKGITYRPWDGHGAVPEADGGWPVIAPSALAFAAAARRARIPLHQFLSPSSIRRHDRYGGAFENRTHLLREDR